MPDLPASPSTAADEVTESALVLRPGRRVVAANAWLATAARQALERGLTLHVVTGPRTALTLGAATLITNAGGRWVVDGAAGHYDGFGGHRVRRVGPGFDLLGEVSPDFAPDPRSDAFALSVQAEVLHPLDEPVVVGMLLQRLCAAAGLGEPVGMGELEPLGARFDIRALTEVARERSPDPTVCYTSGADADAVVSVIPEPGGILERIDLSAHLPEPIDDEACDRIASICSAAGARYAAVGYRRALAGRYVPPRLTGPQVPRLVLLGESVIARSLVEAAELAGEAGSLLAGPPPLLRLDYALPGAVDVLDEALADEDNPILRHARLLDALA